MIRISTGPTDTGEIVITFPEHAEKVNKKLCVPRIVLDRPTTPSRKAAEHEAWSMIPVPNQDESDADFAVRAAPVLDALGFGKVLKRSGLESAIRAAADTLDLVKVVQMHIRSWQYFGDKQTGAVIDTPTPEAVQALIIDNPLIARKIQTEINKALDRVVREGNA